MTVPVLFGIAAGVLEFASVAVYIRSILKKETLPNRVTWWILALVSGMITASYWASGARETIWLPVAYTTSFIVIGLLSVKYGDGPITLNLLDRACLVGALVSAFIWWFFDSPALALYMNIVIDFIALIPTARKAYMRPRTESKGSWIIAAIASFLNVLAIERWIFVIAAYPIYVCIMNTLITYFIVRRKTVQ